jgi:hypothetical protein
MCRWLHNLFFNSRSARLIEHVHRVDQQNREVRHDLKNIQTRTDALRALVLGMREDEQWRLEQKERR